MTDNPQRKILILKKYELFVFDVIKSCFPENWQVNGAPMPEGEIYLSEADAIIPEHAPVTAGMMDEAKRLKVIQTGAGSDSVDVEAAERRGIRVCNAAGMNAREVSEHVFAFILAWYKGIVRLDNSMKKGLWPEGAEAKKGKPLSALTIGIAGFGNIGRRVAEAASFFGMDIIIFSRRKLDIESLPSRARQADLEVLLSESDAVVLSLSLDSSTLGIIGEKELSLMKKDALLVNAARGSLVDEDALYLALSEKRIGGAALDVFATEPLPASARIRSLDNVILTPHTAAEPDILLSYRKRYSFFYENILKNL